MPTRAPASVSGAAIGRRVAAGRLGRRRSQGRPREAEVQQLEPRTGQHQVAGLQVPVHQPGGVGRRQGVDQLDRLLQQFVHRQRAPSQPRRQGLAGDQLHHQVVDAVVVTHVVQGADVRMVELGEGARLALEAGGQLRRIPQPPRQHLDRHLALEALVPGPVDLTHAAGAQGGDDGVGAEAGAGGQGHGSGLSRTGGVGSVRRGCSLARWVPGRHTARHAPDARTGRLARKDPATGQDRRAKAPGYFTSTIFRDSTPPSVRRR